ncbi:hypothetical protein FRAAL6505 [Frankia alni ACN14a]|uniref:Uncharacterized protein n=1 Tax=Frankia alni (strain DSM 45986 / CECT 9034 / ACN14a) TaxID=326424 RepID=Q0RBQ6_FRAAA|nr:hypothetical protein FRAAL6505 [Frankia alni ACN14a]
MGVARFADMRFVVLAGASRRASAASRIDGVGGKHFAEPIGDWPEKRATSSPAPRVHGHGQSIHRSSPGILEN